MKWFLGDGTALPCRSLPVRGAWIEIRNRGCSRCFARCRSPCGERGLKSPSTATLRRSPRRSPCGERGLKFVLRNKFRTEVWSLPVRGAWIEMVFALCKDLQLAMSLPVRGAWIEISVLLINLIGCLSLPVRGAWIEIASGRAVWIIRLSLPVRGAWIEMTLMHVLRIMCRSVAPRAGSVD